MAGINIRKFLNSFSQNYNQRSSAANTSASSSSGVNSNGLVPMDTSGPKLPAKNAFNNFGENIKTVAQSFKLNVLQNADRATYLKEVMNLPKNLNEFVYMFQRNLTKQQVAKTIEGQQPQMTGQNQPKTLSNIQSQILSQQSQINDMKTTQQFSQPSKNLQNSQPQTPQQTGLNNPKTTANIQSQIVSQQAQINDMKTTQQFNQPNKPVEVSQNQQILQQTGLNNPKTISNIQTQILSQQASMSDVKSPQPLAQNVKDVPTSQVAQPQSGNTTGQAVPLPQGQALAGQVLQNRALNIRQNSVIDAQKQILAEIKDVELPPELEEPVEIILTKEMQSALKKLEILPGGMINLGKLSEMLQRNGKSAITKLIMTMTEASKSGITDLSQMKEMAKFINASISIAAENNPQKTLKLFLLLYLPWLPLEDGVGFDVEIQERKSEDKDESDSILVINVNTINFGMVKSTLILETSNSVQVSVECAENFPKKELLMRIDKEQKFYSMDSVINFKTDENIRQTVERKQSASVNMAQTTEINPFLLLMAHALIKHIIDIDNNKTVGITSHEDKF